MTDLTIAYISLGILALNPIIIIVAFAYDIWDSWRD